MTQIDKVQAQRPQMSRRRFTGRLLAVSGLAAGSTPLLLGRNAAGQQDSFFFRIGTGTTSGNYFLIGGVIANAISNPPGSRPCDSGGSCGVPGLIAIALTTQGSVENIDLLATQALESALCQADVAYWAYSGTGMYKDKPPFDKLRAVANLYQESLQIVVRADSAISSIADLKGKRVSLGERGAGTRTTATLVLNTFGIKEKQVKVEQMPISVATGRLGAGTIDALFVVGGTPIPAIVALASGTALRFLPVDGEKAEALRNQYPFLTVDLLPAGIYPDGALIITVGVGTYWLVSADLGAELVYGITKALWHPSTRKLLDEGSPIGRKIRMVTALLGLPIPLHDGAAKFYSEASQTR
ncbi:MAG: TAXI family TRAP transporter solute-binding subunit [Dongiaceae bacterium]